MKISKLHIEQFRHLENLTFDFTYQSGERKGQPLDKICFIGQSATGKTGLLDLITQQYTNLRNVATSEKGYLILEYGEDIDGEVIFEFKEKKISLLGDKIKVNSTVINQYFESGAVFDTLLDKHEQKPLYYFKANLISEKNIDIFTKNPIDLLEKHSDLNSVNQENLLRNNRLNGIFLFNDRVDSEIWLILLNEFLQYRKNFTQKMSEFIHKGLLSNNSKLDVEFNEWKKENPNKLEEFAKKFNPILEKLNLEVDLVNTKYIIPIANKRNEEIIPIQNTSTGTKGLLLSFLPLFKLDTKDSIILIDEPERSLYPDMQMDLMDYYQNLAPEAQFIVATHSPFVAASFEPDERFILYFDEQGNVAIRRGSSPIGDDPNDMLYNDFGINYINRYGQEKHNEYKELKQKVFFEKDENKKKEIVEKLEKLGEEYNF